MQQRRSWNFVPDEWVQEIPFFVRKHAVTKTIERIADEYPDLYQASRQLGQIPDTEKRAAAQNGYRYFFQEKWLSILSSKLIFLSCCDDTLTRSTAHPVYKFLAYKKYCLQPENIAGSCMICSS